MKIFVLGVPHTQTTLEFTTCAYTMKVYNLCRMMLARGHDVYHIGVEGSNPPCTKHFDAASAEFWRKTYGYRKKTDFYNISGDGEFGRYLSSWGSRANSILLENSGDPHTSIICCSWGGPQVDAVKNVPQFAVESGIGYPCTFAKYRVFESYAWMHMIYGRDKGFGGGFWMDSVIPNAFDPDMFEYKDKKQDYFLFIGRLNDDKGVRLAIDTAKAVGRKIKIVGQGDPTRFLGDGVEYHPPVGVAERSELMSNAACVICPTHYIEPFGGVNVEAQMCGTPVISTDWGAFPETVVHGVTGYRCKTFDHFVWAAKNIGKIDPKDCRYWAWSNFRLDRIGAMYEEFFNQVLALRHEGWTALNPDRASLDYLKKSYPPTPGHIDIDSIPPPSEVRR